MLMDAVVLERLCSFLAVPELEPTARLRSPEPGAPPVPGKGVSRVYG